MPEIHVKESIVINSVKDLGDGRSRWTIKTPVGHMSWESEIIESKENEIIQWRSLPDSCVKNNGSLSLAEKEGGNASEATVEIHYKPPGKYDSFLEDEILEVITDEQMKEDLINLKHMLESQSS